MSNPTTGLYDVRKAGERWELRPSATFALSSTVFFGLGSAFMVYIASIFVLKSHWSAAPLGMGALFLAVAVYGASLSRRS
jgi:VIT1/CCC1 family predicted Fe2+/Mn2+ transporter